MGRIATLVLGGLIGAGIMAATAKKTGAETRQDVKGFITDVKDTATRANAEGGPSAVAAEFVNKGKEAASDAMANGQAAAATATAKVQDAAADMTGSTDADDLKRKIDEARARIVDKVAANVAGGTESAQTNGAGANEAVIESVEDVPNTTASAQTDSATQSATQNTASTPAPGPGAGSATEINGSHVAG